MQDDISGCFVLLNTV